MLMGKIKRQRQANVKSELSIRPGKGLRANKILLKRRKPQENRNAGGTLLRFFCIAVFLFRLRVLDCAFCSVVRGGELDKQV